MNTREEYYKKKLYPLQDGIIEIIKNTHFPFYLTGGTALSRCYYQHRYSDDLDFFSISNNRFALGVKNITANLAKYHTITHEVNARDFIRLFLNRMTKLSHGS